jgi:hypothetical protein
MTPTPLDNMPDRTLVEIPDAARLDAYLAWAEEDPDNRVNETSMAAFVAGWALRGEQP